MVLILWTAGVKAMMVLPICPVRVEFRAFYQQIILRRCICIAIHIIILNLCVVQACSLTFIRNMNSTVTETAYFFNNSAKRQVFLEKVVDKGTGTVRVKDLCRTRWAYRHEAYENFYKLYKYLVAVMELIVTRDSEYGNMDWDSNTVIAANGFLRVYTTFSFIVSFIVAMNAMAIIKPISIKLQSVYYDQRASELSPCSCQSRFQIYIYICGRTSTSTRMPGKSLLRNGLSN